MRHDDLDSSLGGTNLKPRRFSSEHRLFHEKDPMITRATA
jgi:hypothetical protein